MLECPRDVLKRILVYAPDDEKSLMSIALTCKLFRALLLESFQAWQERFPAWIFGNFEKPRLCDISLLLKHHDDSNFSCIYLSLPATKTLLDFLSCSTNSIRKRVRWRDTFLVADCATQKLIIFGRFACQKNGYIQLEVDASVFSSVTQARLVPFSSLKNALDKAGKKRITILQHEMIVQQSYRDFSTAQHVSFIPGCGIAEVKISNRNS